MTFTIIIPCHNGEKTIARTLASVHAQTCEDWSVLLVNDASTDATAEFFEEFARFDARFRMIDGPGEGASAARNLALKHVTTDLIAFLDADDLWEPTRLSVFQQFFDRQADADIAYSRYAFFTEEPGDSLTASTVPRAPLTVLDLMRENPVGTMSNLVMRHRTLDLAGPFREDLTHGEDREWLVRAAARGLSIIGIYETLLHYRTSIGGLSTDLERMYAGWHESVQTAQVLDALPSPHALRSAEAVYLRYLSRRALRLGMPPAMALSYALQGIRRSPVGFFSNGARGPLTLGSAVLSLIAPNKMRKALANR